MGIKVQMDMGALIEPNYRQLIYDDIKIDFEITDADLFLMALKNYKMTHDFPPGQTGFYTKHLKLIQTK